MTTTPAQRLEALESGTTSDQALGFFDSLPPVQTDELLGQWRGSGLDTGNPFDGLLETFGWYGKRFEGADGAHPLLFQDDRGLFNMDPTGLPMSLAARFADRLRSEKVGGLVRPLLRLRTTSKPHARVRMVEYRGVVSATMTYDALPINDHFRRVDETTLLGAMDLRGLEAPFMFVLRRDPHGAQR